MTDKFIDRLHRDHIYKIDLSRAIVVVDCDGYIGKDTASEVYYAYAAGKNIYLTEPLSNVSLDNLKEIFMIEKELGCEEFMKEMQPSWSKK